MQTWLWISVCVPTVDDVIQGDGQNDVFVFSFLLNVLPWLCGARIACLPRGEQQTFTTAHSSAGQGI